MANKRYRDLDLSFKPHPITGDLSKKFDDNDIKQSLRNLVLTNFYERLDENIGTDVHKSLFELDTSLVGYHVKTSIEEVARYEPRAIINDVVVTVVESVKFKVAIYFTTQNSPKPIVLEEFLDLVR